MIKLYKEDIHPKSLIELSKTCSLEEMLLFNLRADMEIGQTTFYDLRVKYPEFKEASEIASEIRASRYIKYIQESIDTEKKLPNGITQLMMRNAGIIERELEQMDNRDTSTKLTEALAEAVSRNL